MGAGDQQIRQWEEGFSAPPAFVCDRHLDDYALEAIIHQEATVTYCDFCDREGKEPFAADAHLILERMSDALRREWTDPDNVLFYDDESESGYGGAAVYDFDVLRAEGEWPFRADKFEEFVLDAFRESTWTGESPAVLSEFEARSYSWQLFNETVKHEVRFLFGLVEEPDEDDQPGYPLQLGGAMLRELGDLINRFGGDRPAEGRDAAPRTPAQARPGPEHRGISRHAAAREGIAEPRRAVEIRPNQQRSGAPRGAPGQLLDKKQESPPALLVVVRGGLEFHDTSGQKCEARLARLA